MRHANVFSVCCDIQGNRDEFGDDEFDDLDFDDEEFDENDKKYK